MTSAMDAYCRKKHIMEEIEIERKKVNRRIGNYFFFVSFFFFFAAVSFLFSLSPPEMEHDEMRAPSRGEWGDLAFGSVGSIDFLVG